MATAAELQVYTQTFTSFSGADIQCVFNNVVDKASI